MKDHKLKPFSPSRCVSIRTWTLTAGFCQRASPDWCVFTASAVCPVRSCTNSSTKLRPITEPCSGLRKRTRQLRQSNSAWSRRCKCPRHSRVSNGTPSDVVRLVRPKPWLLLFSGFPSTRFLTYLGTWERLGVLLIQTVVTKSVSVLYGVFLLVVVLYRGPVVTSAPLLSCYTFISGLKTPGFIYMWASLRGERLVLYDVFVS